MTNITAKITEIFRNLKSDAVPRPPRPTKVEAKEENIEQNPEQADSEQEEIVIEPVDDEDVKDNKRSDKKSKPKKPFFKSAKKTGSIFTKTGKEESSNGNTNVNTQATGNVINIVNSRDVHWGNEFVYHLGTSTTYKHAKDFQQSQEEEEKEEDQIEKDNLITLLMEAKVEPDHEYRDYISKNLGKNWRRFFRSLGYTSGRIETVELDEGKHGTAEVRYKLLLDWMRNDKDGSLGRLATLLWEEGERAVVKQLSVMYKTNKSKSSKITVKGMPRSTKDI